MHQTMQAEPGQDKQGNILAGVSLTSPDHYYERKWEGVRALVVVGETVRLWGRSGRELTGKFPELQGLAGQVAMPAVLDGEIVVIHDGVVDEKAVQSRVQSSRPDKIRVGMIVNPVTYRSFDLLEVTGKTDLTVMGESMWALNRKTILNELVTPSELIQIPLHSEGDGEALLQDVFAGGGEGIMIKRKAGLYHPGKRTTEWIKFKGVETDSFVVCGITAGTGWRIPTFGALLLGKPSNGRMRYCGSVGTGFDVPDLQEMLEALDGLSQLECPFEEPPYEPELRSYLRPQVVVEVKFHKMTPDGKALWPSYQGLRADLSVEDVR